jgi:hypothetical protein
MQQAMKTLIGLTVLLVAIGFYVFGPEGQYPICYDRPAMTICR